MRFASIDVGSNSVRMLIAETAAGGISPIRYERIVTRLASGVDKTGRLDSGAVRLTLEALEAFTGILKGLGVERIAAVGTSALREGENAGEFIAQAKAETGIDVRVVTGIEEAALTASGVVAHMDSRGPSLIVDIGGGSTEWILWRDNAVLKSGSLPLGVVKLNERHIASDPPSGADIVALNRELEGMAGRIKAEIEELTQIKGPPALVATAGTASTLAAIDLGLEVYDSVRVHMHEITLDRLVELSENLLSLPLKERAKVRGLEPCRADLIIPGILLTIRIMKTLGFEKMLVSAFGLLEGALLKLLSEETK